MKPETTIRSVPPQNPWVSEPGTAGQPMAQLRNTNVESIESLINLPDWRPGSAGQIGLPPRRTPTRPWARIVRIDNPPPAGPGFADAPKRPGVTYFVSRNRVYK